MITREKYEAIMRDYGDCASWAIWQEDNNSIFDNEGKSIFDPENITGLLNELNPDIILVGLNASRIIIGHNNGFEKSPFMNFHDKRKGSRDMYLRHALNHSRYRGAYLTDIIKGHIQVDSSKVMKYLTDNPEIECNNINKFTEELKYIGSHNPIIIALGGKVFSILYRNKDNLNIKYKGIGRVKHYSTPGITKEEFKRQFDQPCLIYSKQ